jgi:hypothetical protein
MARYFVLHRLKKNPEEVSNALSHSLSEIAWAMASGQTSCICLKTWSPLAHGREDYLFCLWEAETSQDIEDTIASFGLLDYFTLDTMQVDEIDWAKIGER